jgi:hypothetical protein
MLTGAIMVVYGVTRRAHRGRLSAGRLQPVAQPGRRARSVSVGCSLPAGDPPLHVGAQRCR